MLRKEVKIKLSSVALTGELTIPKNAQGLVIFSHGSGSSRHSVRNKYVANVIQKRGFGTLLFDLLTVEEDRVYETRFDIKLLTSRLHKGPWPPKSSTTAPITAKEDKK